MSFPYQISSFDDYLKQYKFSIDQPEKFWSGVAEHFTWKKKWDKVLDWNFKDPSLHWFEGAQLNITENCLDRHLADKADQTAIIWDPNEPAQKKRVFTYRELYTEVCRFVHVLKNNGVKKGDRVCIYMPMVPELAIAVLSCARMGAIHSVIFGGFSAQSIADRVEDAQCKIVITADAGTRGPKEVPLKATIDEALKKTDYVKKVIVYKHLGNAVNMETGRDVWWQDELKKVSSGDSPAETMNAEDILFILYTSGSTGKPKGVVHTCAGYMIYTTYTFVNVFQYKPGEIYFCTADVGWITGHSYSIYAPLCAGGTTLMFEGIPSYPDAGRFWDIIDKHQVNIFYTAPTAIRSLMAFGLEPLKNKSLESLRVLGTVGEPINEEAWHWYDEHIGHRRCPIVDTWWQTETGGIMISNMAGIHQGKPSYATLPMPGVIPVLVDDQGNVVPGSDAGKDGVFHASVNSDEHIYGNLCIRFPWPSMIRTTYGDHERCRLNYFSTYKDLYFTGDGAFRDAVGNYRITGRVDDVLNVSGHRIGTAEVENAIDMYPDVVESAVVGYPHDIKGQGIYAFVTLNRQHHESGSDKEGVMKTVSQVIGAIARPDKVQFVVSLPRTRSGKIMRRILRKIAEGEMDNLGDTSTLVDPTVVDVIKAGRV